MLGRIDEFAEEARRELEAIHRDREEAYTTSRQVVQSASATIKAVHRGELEEARARVAETRELHARMMAAVDASPVVGYTGFVGDATREYAEAALVLALIEDSELPGPAELGVAHSDWLNGLGDAVGELRRHVLDLIRHDQVEQAERYLEMMDEIYQTLMSFDYPDAVTKGLRQRSDQARGAVERTRGDLTNALRQLRLERRMRELEDALGADH
ncbi:MAG: translin family protein [Armatimonadota bacterium]